MTPADKEKLGSGMTQFKKRHAEILVILLFLLVSHGFVLLFIEFSGQRNPLLFFDVFSNNTLIDVNTNQVYYRVDEGNDSYFININYLYYCINILFIMILSFLCAISFNGKIINLTYKFFANAFLAIIFFEENSDISLDYYNKTASLIAFSFYFVTMSVFLLVRLLSDTKRRLFSNSNS